MDRLLFLGMTSGGGGGKMDSMDLSIFHFREVSNQETRLTFGVKTSFVRKKQKTLVAVFFLHEWIQTCC